MIGSRSDNGNWMRSSSTARAHVDFVTARHETDEKATTTTTKLLLQPDITLIVGCSLDTAAKFVAHRFVLCNHSAYFRTLLATYTGTELRFFNIKSRTFASLLDYMYTGQLDLNSFNVYEILLAGNLLHIADVQDLCKRYLHENRNYSISIVKPIPCRRAAVVDAFDAAKTLKYQPLRIDEDASSIFQPVGLSTSAPIRQEHDENDGDDITSTSNNNNSSSSRSRSSSSSSSNSSNTNNNDNENNNSNNNDDDDNENEDDDNEEKENSSQADSRNNTAGCRKFVAATGIHRSAIERVGANRIEKLKEPITKSAATLTHGVVFDVASCDGPIRFRKVPNRFYNPKRVLLTSDDAIRKNTAAACRGCRRVFESYQFLREYEANGNRKQKQIQNSNYNQHLRQNQDPHYNQDETRYMRLATKKITQIMEKQIKLFSESTTVSGDYGRIVSSGKETTSTIKADNIPYYSCKLCSSKFPSYYFVHKHRKLHHPQTKQTSD